MPRSRLTALATAIAAIIICASCAALPPCPKPKIHALQTSVGMVYFFDQENQETLRQRMQGLEARSCEPDEFWAVDADAEERAS